MTIEITTLKFLEDEDKLKFLVEEGMLDEDFDESKIEEYLENFDESMLTRNYLVRKRRKRLMKNGRRRGANRQKSMIARRSWKRDRGKRIRSLRKFARSVAGKRVRQKVAQARKAGRYRTVNEWFTDVNSILTHLSIQANYTSTITEELDTEELLESAYEILQPVLRSLIFESDEVSAYNLYEDPRFIIECEFIDDLLGFSSDIHGISEAEVDEVILVTNNESTDITLDDSGYDNPLSKLHTDEDGELGTAVDTLLRSNDIIVDADNEDKMSSSDKKKVENGKEGDKQTTKATESVAIVDMVDDDQINESFDVQDYAINEQVATTGGHPDVDGKYVIAHIKGPAFFPNTVSRNKVHYQEGFWECVINKPEFRRELHARRLYGTFGHDVEINDKTIREGLMSHVLIDAYIDENTGIGMAEYLVFDTVSGRQLAGFHRAKSKVRVSTRGRGTFITKRDKNGHKVPNPETFILDGIDFVHDPGYLVAETQESNVV